MMEASKDHGYFQSVQPETKRYCLTLRLKDDPALILDYEKWHQPEHIWKEIPDGIRKVGIMDMEIYRSGNLLFMIMTTTLEFDFDRDMKRLSSLPRQKDWEVFMENYQDALPGTASAEKWVRMDRIFKLTEA